MKTNISHNEIDKAGEKAALIIYKSSDNTIDITRQRLLSQKMLKAKSFVKPETLPPYKICSQISRFRCYYQIMKWLSCDNDIKAEKWGWINTENKYYPRTTDKLSAPESLLKIIHCNCSSDCSTMRWW